MEKIYQLDWVDYSPELRRFLVVTMIRLQKAPVFSLAKWRAIDISFYIHVSSFWIEFLNSKFFFQLLKMTYSFYTLISCQNNKNKWYWTCKYYQEKKTISQFSGDVEKHHITCARLNILIIKEKNGKPTTYIDSSNWKSQPPKSPEPNHIVQGVILAEISDLKHYVYTRHLVYTRSSYGIYPTGDF